MGVLKFKDPVTGLWVPQGGVAAMSNIGIETGSQATSIGEGVYTVLTLGAIVKSVGVIKGADYFQVPVSGWYSCHCSGQWQGSTDDTYRVLVIVHWRGATKTNKVIQYPMVANSEWANSVAGTIWCEAGDRISFEAMHTGGASQTIAFTMMGAGCTLTGGPPGPAGPPGILASPTSLPTTMVAAFSSLVGSSVEAARADHNHGSFGPRYRWRGQYMSPYHNLANGWQNVTLEELEDPFGVFGVSGPYLYAPLTGWYFVRSHIAFGNYPGGAWRILQMTTSSGFNHDERKNSGVNWEQFFLNIAGMVYVPAGGWFKWATYHDYGSPIWTEGLGSFEVNYLWP